MKIEKNYEPLSIRSISAAIVIGVLAFLTLETSCWNMDDVLIWSNSFS